MNVLRHFQQFYLRNSVEVESIFQREFGVGIDRKINYRHKAFSTQKEFAAFLANETPRFVSHSVGRFEFPWAQPMEKKTLLSADLVFDLDAKPEDTHHAVFCADCIDRARKDTLKLLEQFLLPVFGFSEKELVIVFSGSKGFHVHVRSPLVQQLSSTSRRLMTDFITGRELSVDSLVHSRADHSKIKRLYGPGQEAAGWKKHFLETVITALDNFAQFPKKKAEFLSQHKPRVIETMKSGNWDFFHGCENVLNALVKQTVERHGVEVDSPVTFDVHRLIRVPGTLHGDTGLVAKRLTLSELNSFDPSRHAAAFRGTANVNLNTEVKLVFGGQEFELKQGENTVPLSLAVLLACKGVAL